MPPAKIINPDGEKPVDLARLQFGLFFEKSTTKRLGDRLVEAGLITPQQLELAVREQKRSGLLMGAVIQKLGLATEEDISLFLAKDSQTPTIDVTKIETVAETIALVPYEFCKEAAIIPYRHTRDTLTLIMADPFDVVAIDRVEQMTRLKVDVLTAPKPNILEKLAACHEREGSLDQTIDELMKINEHKSGDDTTAPIIRAIEQIIAAAVRKSASDIHFEPDEKSLRIRMRTDGIMQASMLIPKDLQDPFLARIKVMSNLDVSETRLPQDGRFSFTLGRKELNFRVSCLPTSYGESVVLRILDSGNLLRSIRSLGLRKKEEDCLAKAVNMPHGIVLVTGPTGSGKTTTLYTALNGVNRTERSVFTLEDPIEYRLPQIRQTQISEKIGLTFGNGLRTLLRQDPDVILVGETRDTETAQLMVRAALTGHLVFSSLHTNDSISAVPRLIDLGVEPFLLPATLRLIIAQRLVRRLCPTCREPLVDPCEHLRSFNLPIPTDEEPKLWRPRGCPECRQQGYRGRVAIFEIFEIDEDYHPILTTGNVEKLQALALEKGMARLFDDGLRRAFAGDTTLEEIFRVAFSH
ncbi:MAG: Flp pilus assembly complex ATPase component TadA [Verrucomicrobia bacterium]|nr:Flp pilus assembly complex ATPase component TadA [Verrucomicrobiota bacterium]